MLQMDKSNRDAAKFDSAKVKLEGLQKVSDEYVDQKSLKTDGADSSSIDTIALYVDNEFFQKTTEETTMTTVCKTSPINKTGPTAVTTTVPPT